MGMRKVWGCCSFVSESQERPLGNVAFWRSREGGERGSYGYLEKSMIGRGNSKCKGPRERCAQYLRMSKGARVRGLDRGVVGEVRAVIIAVEGLRGHWLVF